MRPLAAAAAAVLMLLPRPAPAEPPDASTPLTLRVAAPEEGQLLVGPVALAAVRGFAGLGTVLGRDVVLLIDTSASTWDAAGYDVDGDGRVGRRLRSADDPARSFNPRRLCTDPGDTIRAAELAAARSFLQALPEGADVRVALVAFDERARTLSPLSHAAEAAAGLSELAPGLRMGGSTDLAAALDEAGALLAGSRDEGRAGVVLLLSDGAPSRPGVGDEVAREETLRAAERLAKRGVGVHAFLLGGAPAEAALLLEDVSARTGGDVVRVRELADLADHLTRAPLGRVTELSIENRSAGERGRAVRILPSGSFDGVVPLAPGDNHIAFVARDASGRELVVERRVRFDPREPQTLEEARALAADLEALRARTLELELAADVERGRAQASRRLLELEAAAATP